VIGHVHTNHLPLAADDLSGDETDFAGAAAEVEDGFAGAEMATGIAAAVVALDDFGWDGLEVLGVVINRAA